MKLLPSGQYQCPRCRGLFDPGSESVPVDKGRACLPCGAAYTASKEERGILNYVKPITRRTLNERAAARRRLEELADQRSVEFSNS